MFINILVNDCLALGSSISTPACRQGFNSLELTFGCTKEKDTLELQQIFDNTQFACLFYEGLKTTYRIIHLFLFLLLLFWSSQQPTSILRCRRHPLISLSSCLLLFRSFNWLLIVFFHYTITVSMWEIGAWTVFEAIFPLVHVCFHNSLIYIPSVDCSPFLCFLSFLSFFSFLSFLSFLSFFSFLSFLCFFLSLSSCFRFLSFLDSPSSTEGAYCKL